MNYPNCPLSKKYICVKKGHYINVCLAIFLNLEKKKNTKKINKSQHNKRNEQYEMVTWLISRYIAP